MLNFAAITPHPPIIIPFLKKTQHLLVKRTIQAMEELAEELKRFQPQTIVIVSPHGPMRYDKFTVNLEENLRGSFSRFEVAEETSYDFHNDIALSRRLFRALRDANFPVDNIRENEIDHGTMIPLYYLTKNMVKKPRVVMLTFMAAPWEMHYDFGKKLREIFDQTEHNIAFIASADLSHRLSEEAPAGYSPYGIKFDKTLIDLLKKNETEKILQLNPDFCEEAGECGLRSILIALGVVGETTASFKQLSYESPLGVGYLVAKWKLKK